MIPINAPKLYQQLVEEWQIQSKIGKVQMALGDITANYQGNDAIGDLLQEWLAAWLVDQKIPFWIPENSQQFPDYYLSPPDTKRNYLELKTFNAFANSPAFDLANFDSYCESLLRNPERLDADYLILSYRMQQGQLQIDQVWLKKIWEITSSSTRDPLKLQIKRNQIYNIRPCKWYSAQSKFKPFESARLFLQAIADTHHHYPQCNRYKNEWLPKVYQAYQDTVGIPL